MFLLLSSVLLLCSYFWLAKENKNLPPAYPKRYPIIGHCLLFLGSLVDVWKIIKEMIHFTTEKGGVSRILAGTYNLYVITDPDDSLTVLNTCLDKSYIYKFTTAWIDEGMVVSDGYEWKGLRKLFNPFFKQRILNQYMGVFNNCGRRLVKTVEVELGKGKFNQEHSLSILAMEMICHSALGLNAEQHYETYHAYSRCMTALFKVLTQRLCQPWLHPDAIYRWSPLKKEYDTLVKTAVRLVQEVITFRKYEMKRSLKSTSDTSGECKPMLDVLLEMAEKDESLTEDIIRQHIETMVVAGFDTNSTLLTIFLTVIGTYPDIQNNIYKELQHVFGDQDRDVEKEDLTKLVYLEAVIKETLRLYSPVPFVARNATVSLTLKNYTIPPGGMYLISIYGINRHPMWGPDAEQFRPDRWLAPGGVPDNPNASSWFSLGKRNCIGKQFAMMALKTTLVHFIKNYEVTADVTKTVFRFDGFLKADSCHDIEIALRKERTV